MSPYAVPSHFEKGVVRTLSNPKGEPRTQHARTPHHQLQGMTTPNGLHFVISHAGDADVDPEKHRLLIHGLVKRPLVFTLDSLARYPMVSRFTFLECGGNSAPLFSPEPVQGSVQALHGLASCAEWSGVPLAGAGSAYLRAEVQHVPRRKRQRRDQRASGWRRAA